MSCWWTWTRWKTRSRVVITHLSLFPSLYHYSTGGRRLMVTDDPFPQKSLPSSNWLLFLSFTVCVAFFYISLTSTIADYSHICTVLVAVVTAGCQAGSRTTFSGNRLPDIVPGQPGIDYPVASRVPSTRFRCEQQEYPGFFADPETGCQVWLYASVID